MRIFTAKAQRSKEAKKQGGSLFSLPLRQAQSALTGLVSWAVPRPSHLQVCTVSRQNFCGHPLPRRSPAQTFGEHPTTHAFPGQNFPAYAPPGWRMGQPCQRHGQAEERRWQSCGASLQAPRQPEKSDEGRKTKATASSFVFRHWSFVADKTTDLLLTSV